LRRSRHGRPDRPKLTERINSSIDMRKVRIDVPVGCASAVAGITSPRNRMARPRRRNTTPIMGGAGGGASANVAPRCHGSVVTAAQVIGQLLAAVFVLVAVHAEVLPVAAIGWIVVMVAVAVVDGQQMERVGLELARALGADPAVNLERALAVALGALDRLRPRFAN
jgi:hypothetical protein